ncbi:coiled-coil domain-containing protein 178 isoform X10 [Micropterus dolomieu]|uniref:coiled-coil domain-containing protein 178 isoform X10 n=1 Tax=Micropterus dolomieu TaxID=147949 RepID=UPI001E8E206C|nr:coiled-coil domain-containing protein 178 isoform X10 [Micropterus dolomieu]
MKGNFFTGPLQRCHPEEQNTLLGRWRLNGWYFPNPVGQVSAMPDVEPLRFPSREGRPSQQDQADLQAVCSGRRRTCVLLNSPSPCVDNAIYHIQELKMTVENWCQQSGKYEPPVDQDKHQYSNILRFHSSDLDTESVTSTELFVEGVGISARESCPLSPLVKKINDVLGEVVYLIERLEADRQYVEEALQKEKRRKRFLENKVDSISLWKQQEHSFVVQKEHEACIRDITELKWQLKLEREKLDQAQEKLSQTEMLNQHLHEDISFAKKQVPIVKENLDLQRGIINQINTAQAEAYEVHSKTRSHLILVQRELKDMALDADNEKMSMDAVQMGMKNKLAIRFKKAVKLMHEERKQMLQKIIDNDEQWEKAKEEVTEVVAQHSVTQTKLEEQEQLTFMEEQRARKEIEDLKKDLTGQMTALELLKGQCANINEELYRQQRSSEITNQKLHKEFEDASSATKALETKIEKIKKMAEHLEKIQSEHRNTLVNFEKEKKLKSDKLKAAQDLHSAIIKRHDNTLGRISDLMKKSEEYRDASDKMEKIVENMPEFIAELQSVFDVVEFKNKSAALIMSTLQSDINNCQQRTQRSMQTHTAHFAARKKQMEDTKEALKIALKENKQLADEYKGLKKILMEAKQETVSAMSEKNHTHKSFHYYTQLSLLQKRMHKALVKYFKQRSLYSQAELDRCQALSRETDQKIKTAQVFYRIEAYSFAYYSDSMLCLALFEPHPASQLPCVFFAKQGQPGKHPPRLCASLLWSGCQTKFSSSLRSCKP